MDPITVGWHARIDRARATEEYRDARRAVVNGASALVLAYPADERTGVLQSVGGWSALIRSYIDMATAGAKERPLPNGIGMPTAEAWWVWRALADDIEGIRFEAQRKTMEAP